MKVLVTGANGQLGKEIKFLLKQKPEIEFFGTDIDTLDITDKNAIDKYITDNKINFIVNSAAYTAVDLAEDEVETAYKVNTDAVENLSKISDKYSLGFITVSTDYVFDGHFFKPIKENQIPNPVSVYGKSKYEGEKKAISHNQNSIIIRTSWLYSKYGKNFVKTMLALSNEKEQLTVVDDQISSPTFARDLAKVIIEMILQSKNNLPEYSGIYHFSNEGICSWYDFAYEIIKLSGNECKILPVPSENYPTKAARPFYSVLDKNKIKKSLNIEIPHWKDSLSICIKELLE